VEHSTDPAATFAEMSDLLMDPGLILFSTLVQPADIDQQRLNWWYAAPRNGHVSLYSKASLKAIASKHQWKMASFNENLHLFFRDLPEYARSFVRFA
jgi:2-polyprenyl-6-hydroxyphenyl methylase/3-demethylubiquinone-9 3-methyltransferase